MPKTVLGIQITPTEALAVHLKGGWRTLAVDRVVRVDFAQIPHEERSALLVEAELPHADALVAAIPADAAFQRLVDLPFGDRAKVEQAAPLEAEESLPLPMEELACHTHLLVRHPHHTKALVAAAPEERVADLLEELRAAGLTPQVVDVEALALAAVAQKSVPGERPIVVLDLSPRIGQGVLLTDEGPWSFHAFSAEPGQPELIPEVNRYLTRWQREELAPKAVYLSGTAAADQDLTAWSRALGVPVALLPLPADGVTVPAEESVAWPGWAIPLGLALREGYARNASQINLLQGAFAPNRETGPWKRAAVVGGAYAAILLILWGVGVWSRLSFKETQYQALKSQVREEFVEAFPEVTNIVSEIDQMRVRVDELENRAASLGSLVDREVSPLRILREVSARIPQDQEVEVRDFTVEEGRVRLEGATTSFDAIDKITADLAQYPRFTSVSVSDAKTGVERNRVLFRLTINLGRKS